jgi:hypothetical protein
MFLKGSRYRRLPQSSHLTARGEALLGVDVRFIPAAGGQFLHTVSAHDRLDLLAFKYYGDARRWWLIADANRGELDHPVDLLDTHPFAEEEWSVVHPELLTRCTRLLAALRRLGTAELGSIGDDGAPAPDAYGMTMTVIHSAATTRTLMMSEITQAGFRVVSSFSWPRGSETAEAFSLADPAVTASWNALLSLLSELPGVRRVQSLQAGRRLRLGYNTALLTRQALVDQLRRHGFEIVPAESHAIERVGSRIVIPPNQAP